MATYQVKSVERTWIELAVALAGSVGVAVVLLLVLRVQDLERMIRLLDLGMSASECCAEHLVEFRKWVK